MHFEVFTRRYDVSATQLWSAVKEALAVVENVDVRETDDGALRARFSTSMGLFSWGQNLTAEVSGSERGGALLRVHGEPRSTFLASRWGEDAQARPLERDLLSALEHRLG